MPPLAVPYCGSPPVPDSAAAAWNLDPLLVLALAVGFFICLRRGVRVVPLAAGFAVLIVLFVSPFCALGSALLSARSAHHLVLSAAAAPMIAAALPRGGRNLPGWVLAHGATFWMWYAPPAYAFALASDAAYWAMQASLLWSATGVWRAVRDGPAPASVAALLATMMQMGLLGALLTFAMVPLYPWHGITTQAWSLAPLEDQQLAGLIMWVVGGGIYLAAALHLAGRRLGEQRLHAA